MAYTITSDTSVTSHKQTYRIVDNPWSDNYNRRNELQS
jgi:hypothetical protein